MDRVEKIKILNKAYLTQCINGKWTVGKKSVSLPHLKKLFNSSSAFPTKFIVGQNLIDIPPSIRWEERNDFVEGRLVTILIQDFTTNEFREDFLTENPSKDLLKKIMGARREVHQVLDDGLVNIFPLCLEYNMTSSQLREVCGKGAWKFYSGRGVEYNAEIAKLIREPKLLKGFSQLRVRNKFIEDGWSPSLFYPPQLNSSSLKYLSRLDIMSECGDNELKSFISSLLMYFNDTKRMCKDANREFNPEWSPKRMKREHDRLSRMVSISRYGISEDEEFPLSKESEKILLDFKNDVESVEYRVLTRVMQMRVC